MIRPSFETALKKGEVGEQIVRRRLEESGWVVYQPVTSGAHCFDMLSIKGKRSAVAFDVKAKAKMNKYDATGINQRHFEEYTYFSEKHSMAFWVVFVDEALGQVYGNSLKQLEKLREHDGHVYPKVITTRAGTAIRLWPVSAMVKIGDLDAQEIDGLTALSQRSYEYEITGAI